MNINVISPVNSLGYGIAATQTMLALDKAGVKVSYFPVTSLNDVQPPLGTKEKIKEFYQNGFMPDFDAPTLRIWHQFDMSMRVGRGPFYAFPFFELEQFTDREKWHLSNCENIIVTCDWAADVIKREVGNNSKIHKVPLGVDLDIFKPASKTIPSKTVFLTVGKWEVRKGHDVLCRAFNKAFNSSYNVELWLLCNNPFLNDQQTNDWQNLFRSGPMGNKIRFLPRQESSYDVCRIMNQADCGVFLSRGEGWNLELLEMMACGKQVIATNATAHKEYCTSQNSLLVETHGTELAYDGVFFHNQGHWQKITDESIDQIVEYMQMVHRSKCDGLNLFNEAGVETARTFSWDNAARKLIGCLYGNADS